MEGKAFNRYQHFNIYVLCQYGLKVRSTHSVKIKFRGKFPVSVSDLFTPISISVIKETNAKPLRTISKLKLLISN